eukprot:gene43072-62370_t
MTDASQTDARIVKSGAKLESLKNAAHSDTTAVLRAAGKAIAAGDAAAAAAAVAAAQCATSGAPYGDSATVRWTQQRAHAAGGGCSRPSFSLPPLLLLLLLLLRSPAPAPFKTWTPRRPPQRTARRAH